MSLAGFCEWLQASALSIALQSTYWVVPVLQSLHIVMIGVVFVSVLAVAALAFGRRVAAGAGAPGGGTSLPPAGLRLAAVATVVLWLAIIVLGRFIAYDEAIWGVAAARGTGG